MPKPSNVIRGTGQSELLIGTANNDVILAKGGNDTLVGNEGSDTLDGGRGVDTLDYSAEGGPGPIRVNLWAGGSQGGLDPDTAIDSFGFTDSVPDNQNVIGTAFNDEIYGGGHDNRLEGRGGDDFLFGMLGNDTLLGGGNNDRLIGGEGNDMLFGGGGNDTLTGSEGSDTLDGGDGNDTLDYSAEGGPGPIEVNLWAGGSQNNLDPDTAIDSFGFFDSVPDNANVIGTAFNDEIYGGGHDNRLEGRGGDDYLFGMLGNDALIGGGGNDTVEGGADNDRFVFDAPTGTSTDSVVDFGLGSDQVAVFGVDYGLPTGALDPDFFETGDTPTKGHAEFLYDTTANTLYWDADGSAGNSVAIATFVTAANLSSTDFLIL